MALSLDFLKDVVARYFFSYFEAIFLETCLIMIKEILSHRF